MRVCDPSPHQARLPAQRDAEKVRALAQEILNDWNAILAFVGSRALPPTNDEAKRALRLAVIVRSSELEIEKGSAAYAASFNVVEPCRRRKVDPA